MEIQCTGYDNVLTEHDKEKQINSSDLMAAKVDDKVVTTINLERCRSSSQNLSPSTWKCSPIIELTIIE
jgi:hypothetical protein